MSTHKNDKKDKNGKNDKNYSAAPWAGEEVVSAWNAAGLRECRTLTPKRKAHLNARLKSTFFVENWKQALSLISVSDFCRGNGRGNWKADLDWFIRSDDATAKAIEGSYNNQSSKKSEPDYRSVAI